MLETLDFKHVQRFREVAHTTKLLIHEQSTIVAECAIRTFTGGLPTNEDYQPTLGQQDIVSLRHSVGAHGLSTHHPGHPLKYAPEIDFQSKHNLSLIEVLTI
jgi:hypothetical protein